MEEVKLFINGEFLDNGDREMKQNINPSVTTPYSGNCMAMPVQTSPFQKAPPLAMVKNSTTTAIRPNIIMV